ncbi:uncharacterized protein [Maniola hyperantus]|uniref:uncharacterized protein isoform X2 n=1 Tax=Aphantopus hyperantus TaxID=2795564 RepID=UPI003749D0B8
MTSEACAAAASDGEVTVRAMRREDVPVVHRMIHELAAFEGMPEGPKLSVKDLIEDGFSSSPSWFFGLVAEVGGEVAGYALCSRAYSSWTRRAFYVEDLYVRRERRGAGVGRRLLRELCEVGTTAPSTWRTCTCGGSGAARASAAACCGSCARWVLPRPLRGGPVRAAGAARRGRRPPPAAGAVRGGYYRALYVEDLYVRRERRGAGVGRRLLRELCEVGTTAPSTWRTCTCGGSGAARASAAACCGSCARWRWRAACTASTGT